MKTPRVILGVLLGLGALGVAGAVIAVSQDRRAAPAPTPAPTPTTPPPFGIPGRADPSQVLQVGTASGWATVTLTDTGTADVTGHNPAGWDTVSAYIPGGRP